MKRVSGLLNNQKKTESKADLANKYDFKNIESHGATVFFLKTISTCGKLCCHIARVLYTGLEGEHGMV